MPLITASTMPTTLAHVMPRSRQTPAANTTAPRIRWVQPQL